MTRCGKPERKVHRMKMVREGVSVEGLNEDEKRKLRHERWQEEEADVKD
jgi:hypothetical protein